MSKKNLCVLIAVVVFSTLVLAVPGEMQYQGKLTDALGVGINDTLDMTFRIYDDPTAGSLLWSETHAGVGVAIPIVKGLFDAPLGTITPITIDFSIDYWMEIEVDGSILDPRVKLATSPYAFRAAIADSVVGGGGNTLDEAYDEGGPGVGATIDATDGPVDVRTAMVGPSDGTAFEIRTDDDVDEALYVRNAGAGPAIFCSGDFRINPSDKYLSNADIIMQIDANGGGTDQMRIQGDAGTDVITIEENGDFVSLGQGEVMALTHTPQIAPPISAEGKVYYHDVDNELYVYDGTAWQPLIGGAGGPDNDWVRDVNYLFPLNLSDSVGIGTTTPDRELEVAGRIKASISSTTNNDYVFIAENTNPTYSMKIMGPIVNADASEFSGGTSINDYALIAVNNGTGTDDYGIWAEGNTGIIGYSNNAGGTAIYGDQGLGAFAGHFEGDVEITGGLHDGIGFGALNEVLTADGAGGFSWLPGGAGSGLWTAHAVDPYIFANNNNLVQVHDNGEDNVLYAEANHLTGTGTSIIHAYAYTTSADATSWHVDDMNSGVKGNIYTHETYTASVAGFYDGMGIPSAAVLGAYYTGTDEIGALGYYDGANYIGVYGRQGAFGNYAGWFEGNFHIDPQTAPGSPVMGDIYADNTTNKAYFYDGASWVDMTATPGAGSSQWTAHAVDPYIFANNNTTIQAYDTGEDTAFVVDNSAIGSSTAFKGVGDYFGSTWGYVGYGSALGGHPLGWNGAGIYGYTNGSIDAIYGYAADGGYGVFGVVNGIGDYAGVRGYNANSGSNSRLATQAYGGEFDPGIYLIPGTANLAQEGAVYANAADHNLYFYDGTSWVDLTDAGVGGSGTLNYIPKWTPDGTTLGDSQIRDNAATVAINVSPAYTNANARVEIYHDADGNISASADNHLALHIFSDDENIGSGPAIGFSNSVIEQNVGAKIGFIRTGGPGTQSIGDLAFYTKETPTPLDNNLERLRIISTGEVGINTSTPTALLELQQPDGAMAAFGVKGGTGEFDSSLVDVYDYLGFLVHTRVESGFPNMTSLVATGDVSSNYGSLMRFYTRNYTERPSERMRIDQEGNVGIGTSSPTAKLDVAGDVYIDGKLTVTGLVDPTGYGYAPQAVNPLPAGMPGTWVDNVSNELHYYDGTVDAVISGIPSHDHWGESWTGSGSYGLSLNNTDNDDSQIDIATDGNGITVANYKTGTSVAAIEAFEGDGTVGGTYSTGRLAWYADATVPGSPTNVAVYGSIPAAGAGGYAIYGENTRGTAGQYAGYFNGPVNIDGDLTVTGSYPGVGGRGTGVDNYIARWDGTDDIQTSGVYIDDGGYMGFGTTVPDYDVDINNTTGSSWVRAKNTSGYAGMIIDRASDTQNGYLIFRTNDASEWFVGEIGVGGSNSDFAISTAFAAPDGKFYIQESDGRVGIGTTTPTARLHVNGTLRGTSTASFAGAVTVACNDASLVLDESGFGGQRYSIVSANNHIEFWPTTGWLDRFMSIQDTGPASGYARIIFEGGASTDGPGIQYDGTNMQFRNAVGGWQNIGAAAGAGQWEDAGVYKRVIGNDDVRAYETGQDYGFYADVPLTTAGTHYAYLANVTGSNAATCYGLDAYSGVYGGGGMGGSYYGVRAEAEWGDNNYGVYGTAAASNTASYGIYGTITSTDGTGYAIYGDQASGDWAGYFNGDVNITGDLTVAGSGPWVGGQGVGVDNYIARWDGTDDIQTSGVYIQDDGDIGIGTASPSYEVDINKADVAWFRAKSTGGGGYAGMYLDRNADSDNAYIIFQTAGAANWFLGEIGEGAPNSDFAISTNFNPADGKFCITEADGYVGMGTASPTYPLHVTSDFSGFAYNGDATAHFMNTSGTDAAAVYGYSADTDNYGYGAFFQGGYYGVRGVNNPTGSYSYYGVYGRVDGGSGTNYAIRGYGQGTGTNYGVYGSTGGIATTNYGVYGYGGSGATTYYGVYYSGNLAGTGTKSAIVRTEDGPKTVYCQESPENWFEDFGSAVIRDGRAHVEVAQDFLQTVTVSEEYPMKVFIQMENTSVDYKLMKNQTGFDIEVIGETTEALAFDYRVVAKRRGYEDLRLKSAPDAYSDVFLYPSIEDVPQEWRLQWVLHRSETEREDFYKYLTSEQLEKIVRKDPVAKEKPVATPPAPTVNDDGSPITAK